MSERGPGEERIRARIRRHVERGVLHLDLDEAEVLMALDQARRDRDAARAEVARLRALYEPPKVAGG